MLIRKKIAIGIDLGTTTSCVSYKNQIIELGDNSNIIPSVIAFSADNNSLLYGQYALNQSISNPQRTLYEVKRLIGQKYNELSKDTTNKLSYKVVSGKDNFAEIDVPGQQEKLKPYQVSAYLLSYIKKRAEEKLNAEIVEAVITVPAYFNDNQREQTKSAGIAAGLKVLRIINEPTSAALAYNINSKNTTGKILVYDMGGGTFDVSIVETGDGVLEVKATHGDTYLGGADFDQKIISYLHEKLKQKNIIIDPNESVLKQRLRSEAKQIKESLSSNLEYSINLPFIAADKDGPKHLECTITRSEFENMSEDLIKRAANCCVQSLSDANLDKNDIDKILLVGGMTRMPRIKKWVKEFFGKEPNCEHNPDEVVALGAGISANTISELDDSQGDDNNEILVLDVTPLSLGIETLGGVFTTLVPKNTTIPTKKSQIFSTAEDNQPKVRIAVYQGERKMAVDNKLLGDFELGPIKPAPRGMPQIEVTFDLDANGIVHVSALDKSGGKSANITVTGSNNIPQEEIDKIQNEAQKFEDDDNKRKEFTEELNILDSIAHESNKLLKDGKDNLSKEDIDNAEQIFKELDEIKNQRDHNKIEQLKDLRKKIESLMPILQKAAQKKPAEANDPQSESSNNSQENSSKSNESDDDKDSENKTN